MNSAKKIMKNQGLGKGNPAQKKQEAVSKKNKVLIGIGVAIVLVLCIGVCYIQLRPRPILTVQGTDKGGSSVTNTVYYKEAMYDIYSIESQYNMYEKMYGTSFWDAENMDKDGRTGAALAKKQVMDNLKRREILYMEALKNDITLDDAANKKLEEDVKSARENMTEKQKGMRGLDEATIRISLEKQAYADKYKEAKVAELNIDEEALKKERVNKKDYRQYTLQYYSFDKKDTSGKEPKDKDAATLKKGKADMEALHKKAVSAADFTKDIIKDANPADQKDDETGIQYQTYDLVGNDTSFLDEKTRKAVKKMKNGAISDVIETDDAYYVIKMVNNNDPKAYDEQCKQVISEEKDSQFDNLYNTQIVPNYTTEVQSYWKGRVTLGYITEDSESEK